VLYNLFLNVFKKRQILFVAFFIPFLGACSSLFYYPSQKKFSEPKRLGFQYEEVKFESLDHTQLVGWYFPASNKKVKTKNTAIIQFHGNAENISTHFYSVAWLTEYGYDVFTFDYRGYGASAGTPNPKGVWQDVQAAYLWTLKTKPQLKSVILYGQSLGGTALMGALQELPHKDKIGALILEASFLSYQDIANSKLSGFWLTWPFQWLSYILIGDKYSGEEQMKAATGFPVLVIHSKKDEVIPFEFGQEIYCEASAPKFFWSMDEGHHIEAFAKMKRQKQLIRLLDYFGEKDFVRAAEALSSY